MNYLWWLLYLTTAVTFGLLLFTVVTAGLHEIAEARQRLLDRKTKRFFWPKVTILVPAHNERLVIERCLRSIAALDYPFYRVVVVNDGSSDETSHIAREVITELQLDGTVLDVYPNRGKGGALNYAIEQFPLNELVMIIDADCTIAPGSLRAMARQFDDKTVMAANANVRIHNESSLMSRFQQIEYIIGYYHKRHNAFTGSEFIIGGQGATYRSQAVRQLGGFREQMQTEDIDLSLRIAAKGSKANRLIYVADAVLFTEAVPNVKSLYRQRYRWKFGALQAIFANRSLIFSGSRAHSRLLTWFRLPQTVIGEARLLVDALLLLLFIGLAINERSLWIFFGAWFTVSVYSMFIIASDQLMVAKEKLRLIALNSLLYPLHIGMSLLNITAAVQTIVHWKQLVGKEAIVGKWVPPDRTGRQVLR